MKAQILKSFWHDDHSCINRIWWKFVCVLNLWRRKFVIKWGMTSKVTCLLWRGFEFFFRPIDLTFLWTTSYIFLFDLKYLNQGRFQSFTQRGANWRAKRAENFWHPTAGGGVLVSAPPDSFFSAGTETYNFRWGICARLCIQLFEEQAQN